MRTRNTVIALVAALALILTVVSVIRPGGDQPPSPSPTPPEAGAADVSLVPAAFDPAGLDPAGELVLSSPRPLALAMVRAGLSVEPAVDLRVEQADREGTRFTIAPSAALQPDRIYRFRLAQSAGVDRDYQWSFQTRSEFRLLGTLPADESTGVPVNTGIEFTFSHDDYADPSAYFSISPAAKGRWERHKKTAVFVPSDPLEPGTIYTVTLKEGLGRTKGEGRLGAHTFAFETADSATASARESFVLLDEAAEFGTDAPPYFRIWDPRGGTGSYAVAVYRYPDAARYVAALREAYAVPGWSSVARNRYREPTRGLVPVAEVTATPMELEYERYLVLPEPLSPGYYLAEVQLGDQVRQARFQVTDLTYYVAESTTGSLVWLNDLATGGPAAEAQLYRTEGTPVTTAGEDGVAWVEAEGAEGEVQAQYWVARSGGKEVVVHSAPHDYWYRSWGGGRESQAQLYWRYLYLDRSIYKPSDTVHVWGILHPREREAGPVDAVRVKVTRSDYWWEDSQAATLVSATLPVERSSFIGSLPLPNLTPGYYRVSLLVGEELFASRWFEVATYAKPAYQIEVTPDREALFSGETVEFRVRATFFEGTPVPDMRLDYHLNKGSGGSVTTDANGEAVISITPPHASEAWGGQDTLYFTITAGEPEVGEVTEEETVLLFQRDVMAQSEVAVDGDRVTVTAQLNRVVLDQLNAGTGRDVQGPAVAGRTVEFTVTEQGWNRIEVGDSYDFIEKVVRKQYRYEPVSREVARGTAESDADGRAAFQFTLDPEKQYEVRFRTQDSRGLWLTSGTWVTGRRFAYPDYGGWPQLVAAEKDQYRVAVGEPVEYVFQQGYIRMDDRPDGFLFFTARRGIQGYTVQDSPSHTVALKAADLPNFTLHGVAFDGRGYLSAERTVWVDPEERRLKVTVTPDREDYRPGDEVRVQVAVQDVEGRPAPGTVVNLNLVDEALFAVQEQYVDILGDLYGEMVSSGVVRTYGSHEPPPSGGAAEKGGEGGSVRRDFRDAVLFTTVTTDDAGRATASFRVPDNLTSWRLTYQAFRPETVEAENGAIGIPVKLPFFADLVMGETFLVGERPAFQVRSYGTALAPGAEVSYRVEVEGPSGYRQQLELTGRPFDPVSVPLEPLPAAGTYTVRVTAAAGGLSDALERTLAVRETHLAQNLVDFRLLEPGARLTGADDGLTYVTFLDWERGRYLDLLHRSRWLWSSRFEAKLARTAAADLLRAHFGWEDPWPEPELETLRYQTREGSIAILPYSDGDLKLSALAADLAPERFDRAALADYFRRVLEDEGESRERKAMALYGLAGLDAPVLLAGHQLLTEPELTPLEQLFAMLAVAELGDLEAVRPLYRSLVAEHGEEIGRDLRLTVGADRDEQLEATALAAALAAKLGEAEAARMISYLAEHQPDESLIHLEQLLAASSGLDGLKGEPVGITYRLNGEEHRKELKPGERLALALRPDELASLEVTGVQGSVAAVVTYTKAGRPTVAMAGGSVVRSYSPAPVTWRPGDIVTVTLTYSLPADAPDGGYELTDTLPSGLRYLERPWVYGQRVDWSTYSSWAMQVDGQRVTFWAGKYGKPVQYRARVVSAGEYRAEEAVLQHQKSGLVYGMGPAESVSIGVSVR